MRPNHTPVKLAIAAMFTGGLAVAAVGVARAESPRQPTIAPAPSRLDTENDNEYIEHMRAIRTQLNEVRKSILKENMGDRAGHRHEALEAIDKAINAVNQEVIDYDKDLKK